jgi:hypothetical protein
LLRGTPRNGGTGRELLDFSRLQCGAFLADANVADCSFLASGQQAIPQRHVSSTGAPGAPAKRLPTKTRAKGALGPRDFPGQRRRSDHTSGRSARASLAFAHPCNLLVLVSDKLCSACGQLSDTSVRLLEASCQLFGASGQVFGASSRMFGASGQLLGACGSLIDPSRRVLLAAGRS